MRGIYSKKLSKTESMNCPVCHGRAIGILSKNHFFCADCCTEIRRINGEVKGFKMNLEGDSMKITI